MKAWLLPFFLLLFSAQFVYAQKNASAYKPIDNFLGVKFGTPKKDIIERAQSLGGVLKASRGDSVVFDRIIISGRPTLSTVFYTSRNKFRQGLAYFKPSSKKETTALFTQMMEEINDVYGKGDLHKSVPSKEISEQELRAIETGKGTVNCTWSSYTDYVISLEITEDLLVRLTYQDKTQPLN